MRDEKSTNQIPKLIDQNRHYHTTSNWLVFALTCTFVQSYRCIKNPYRWNNQSRVSRTSDMVRSLNLRWNPDIKYDWHRTVTYLTLIRESWKNNPKRGTITERVLRKKISSVASFVYVSVLWIFPGNHARWWPQKMAYILFSTAYFRSYWHMLFEISIIR